MNEAAELRGWFNPLESAADPAASKRSLFCRACGHYGPDPVFDLGEPRLNGFPLPGGDPPPKAPLCLAVCHSCGLAQLTHTADPALCFSEYWYRSGVTRTMRVHLEQVAEIMFPRGKPGLAVDIGCNDGTLLSMVPDTWDTAGFDPALNLIPLAREAAPRAFLFDEAFSGEAWDRHTFLGGRKAKAVTALAMFYDLDDPGRFLRDVADRLEDDGVLLIQVAWLLDTIRAADVGNICHEHLTYWHLGALMPVLARAGFHVRRAWRAEANGGSLMVACGLGPSPAGSPGEEALAILHAEAEAGLGKAWPVEKLRRTCDSLRNLVVQACLPGLRQPDGTPTLGVLGASTKGNYMLQHWGLGPREVRCAAERDGRKVGRTTASGIPIVSEEQARRECTAMLVLPWHFRQEIIEREQEWIGAGGVLVFPEGGIWIADRKGFRQRAAADPGF